MKFCLFVVALIVGFFAVLHLVPHKIHAAVSMKGWDGFSKLVVANVAQRQLGQRHTKSRDVEPLRDVDQVPRAERRRRHRGGGGAGPRVCAAPALEGLEAYVINADLDAAALQEFIQPGAQVASSTSRTPSTSPPPSRPGSSTSSTAGAPTRPTSTSHSPCTRTSAAVWWSSNVLTEAAYPRSSVSGLNFTPDPSTGAYRLYVSATKPARALRPNEHDPEAGRRQLGPRRGVDSRPLLL